MKIISAMCLLVAGCVQTVPPGAVVGKVESCKQRGGIAVVQTMSRYNDAVRRVVCYLPEVTPPASSQGDR